MKWPTVLSIIFSSLVFAKEDPTILYRQVFKDYSNIKEHQVVDTISENPINDKILEFFDSKSNRLGYAREIVTTTGCNSACLPIIATLFYTPDQKFLGLRSRDGLTKKNHVAFSQEDYQNMEMILLQNPPAFKKIQHPKQMVDAITGETTKDFSAYVVHQAAYSSLRLNLYNQDTLKLLQSIQ